MKRLCCKAIAIIFLAFFGLSGTAFSYGNGDFTVYLNGGDNVAYIGQVNTLEIWIANDDVVMGMSPAIVITFSTSLQWDMGYGSHPPVNEEGRAVNCWNLPDLVISQGFDNISPDSIMIGGAAMPGLAGLPIGPSELCYTLQFTIPAGQPEMADAISIVPCLYPPAATWTFSDAYGGYPPDFCDNPVASEVTPVAPPATFDVVRQRVCGDVDCSNSVNIADCVYTINYIFKGGPAPCSDCP